VRFGLDTGTEDGEDGVEAPPGVRRRWAVDADHYALISDLDVETRVGRAAALMAERHRGGGGIVVLAQAGQGRHAS
jgi:hypothetical protein